MRVFKMSSGVDINRAGVQDLVVDSEHGSPKIYTLARPPHTGDIFVNWQTTTPIPLGTTKIIYSFPHNFTYTPTVFASYRSDDGVNQRAGTLPLQFGAIGMITIDADATNINLKYFSFDISGTGNIGPFTLQVRFYVMVERGL